MLWRHCLTVIPVRGRLLWRHLRIEGRSFLGFDVFRGMTKIWAHSCLFRIVPSPGGHDRSLRAQPVVPHAGASFRDPGTTRRSAFAGSVSGLFFFRKDGCGVGRSECVRVGDDARSRSLFPESRSASFPDGSGATKRFLSPARRREVRLSITPKGCRRRP